MYPVSYLYSGSSDVFSSVVSPTFGYRPHLFQTFFPVSSETSVSCSGSCVSSSVAVSASVVSISTISVASTERSVFSLHMKLSHPPAASSSQSASSKKNPRFRIILVLCIAYHPITGHTKGCYSYRSAKDHHYFFLFFHTLFLISVSMIYSNLLLLFSCGLL